MIHETPKSAPDRTGLEGLAKRGALHEIFSASPADAAAATCFALGLFGAGRLLWARQEMARMETGALYPPGLAALGFDPAHITLVPLRDAQSILQAGLEAARTRGLPAAIIELWGAAKPYGLTASRKLNLAAKATGVSICVLFHAAEPSPSAAETRWRVRRLGSRLLAANAPGRAAFEAVLLRHRGGGAAEQRWLVEWNHEQRRFEKLRMPALGAAPLFKPLVSLPSFRKLRLHKMAR